MERTHYLNNPFTARFVRFYPTQWNEQVAMRAGVLGCPYKGSCLPGYFRVNDDSSCGKKQIQKIKRKRLENVGTL
jgi:hypothetical protein